MSQAHTYFIKVFGIILVLLVFVLGIGMEWEYEQPVTIIGNTHIVPQTHRLAHNTPAHTPVKHKGARKMHTVKHITVKLVPPTRPEIQYNLAFSSISHAFKFSEQYDFLYFKEINPPPPKDC